MFIFLFYAIPFMGVLLLLSYVSLLRKIVAKQYSNDQLFLCCVLTFVFLAVFMYTMIGMQG